MNRIDALDQLRGDFVQLAEAEQKRTAQPRRQARMHRMPILIAATALAAAFVAGVIITTMHTGSDTSANGGAHSHPITGHGGTAPLGGHGFGGIPLPPIGKDPFGSSGRRVSLAQAQAMAGYPFPVPRAPAANSDNLSYVWIARGGAPREVAFQYRSTGVRVFIKVAPAPLTRDPLGRLKLIATEMHLGKHAVRRVAGSVVLVISQPGITGGPAIEMAYPGTHDLEIQIIGSDRTIPADLVAVADSMAKGS